MKFRSLKAASTLFAALSITNIAWADPTVYNVNLTPNPLNRGRVFNVIVGASADVTQATILVEFHRSKISSLQLSLSKQGTNWVGSSTIPNELEILGSKTDATVRAIVFDALGKRNKKDIVVDITAPPIVADFTGGILSVTGDHTPNSITAGVDLNGNIIVNNGTVPISGGVPTLANTTLIRMFGLNGNDTLVVDSINGMPPSNLSGGEGNDSLTGSNSADELDGGPGDDTLIGRAGTDRLIGGTGNDSILGGQGTDEIFGGADNDLITWNPGDSSDVIEGEAGEDTLQFNGANIAETIDIFANGARLNFRRNIASILLDCGGIEHVNYRALGGADIVNVTSLLGTGVTETAIDLDGSNGLGDGAIDTINVVGTDGDDQFILSGDTNEVRAAISGTTVKVTNFEIGSDEFVVFGMNGKDTLDASLVEAGSMDITLNGGAAEDTLIGGDGDDVLNGGQGADQILAGPGNDLITWNPGDFNDVIEGEEGQDTLLFRGANIAEKIGINPNGTRITFTRDIANIAMDCNGLEVIQFNAVGGADLITVGDLAGTGVTKVDLDLSASGTPNVGDTSADFVTLNGTSGDDTTVISGSGSSVQVNGLPALVNITGIDANLDQLIIDFHEGDDVGEASALQDGSMVLTMHGGAGDDVLLGGSGVDYLFGEENDDILLGGPGVDILDGGTGNNVVIQD